MCHVKVPPVPPVSPVRPVRDLIYDVGLCHGEDTSLYLALGYRVVAFEASAEHCSNARERFADDLATRRLTIVEGAIAESNRETVTFYLHPINDEWGTTDRNWAERNKIYGESRPVTVPAIHIEEWMRKTGVPYFMKVDIEGADFLCFEALKAFEERPYYVSLESNKTDWKELTEEFKLLESLGYDSFAVVQQQALRKTSTRRLTSQSGSFGADVGPWESAEVAIARYQKIFRRYRTLGDSSFMNRHRLTRKILGPIESISPYPLPGWYDTHARHRSAD